MNPKNPKLRILFAGYAPVHFICFRPLYERLSSLPGVEVFVSGGLRTKTEMGNLYDTQGMYCSFDLPEDRVLEVEALKELDFDLLFAAHTSLILPRSVKKKIQIFHGVSYRNKAIRPKNMGCDHYFLAGPYMHRRFVEAGLFTGMDDARVVPVGFMKTDCLINGEIDRAQARKRLGFTGDRPVLLYAPTGAKHNSLELMGEEALQSITASKKYDLVVKLHDHPKNQDTDWFRRLARFEDAHCHISHDSDIIPLMVASDLLISDASSVANEYTLLDRPLIFLDTPELLAEACDACDSMLDLDTWGRKSGTIVYRPQELAGAIQRSLDCPTANASTRQAIAKDLFYNPGTATETAMAWLQRHVLEGWDGTQFADVA